MKEINDYTKNITMEIAKEMGVKTGSRFVHYCINGTNGNIEKKRKGRVEQLHRFFFTAVFTNKKGIEYKESVPYYILKNADITERIKFKR